MVGYIKEDSVFVVCYKTICLLTKNVFFYHFREFFYIQMEKYARQAMSEGIKTSEELKVNSDSELLRVLNLHYNRNNHIEVMCNSLEVDRVFVKI